MNRAVLVDLLCSRRALAVLWALFLLPRMLVLLIDVAPTSDAQWYVDRAADLAAGRGYEIRPGVPTAYWPVGWPMVLGLAFKALGAAPINAGLVNLAAAAASAWLILDLGRRIHGTEAAGRLALLLYAVFPNAIAYVPLALTEVFYTFLLLALCWLLLARPGWAGRIAAGLVLGLASLVKAQSVLVVPLVLAIALLREKQWWRAVPRTLAIGLLVIGVAGAAILPWSLRNQRELGQFVAISTNGGLTLLTGNNGSADGSFVQDDPLVAGLRAQNLGEVAEDAAAKRLALEWIKANPAAFAALLPKKVVELWGNDGEAQWAYELGMAGYADHAAVFNIVRMADVAFYAGLMLLFVLAAWVQLRQRLREGMWPVDWWLLPYGIALYPTVVAMAFSGQSRFHFPAMPFVCLSVGWLLAYWLGHRASPAQRA